MKDLSRTPYNVTRVWLDESSGSCRGCGPCDVICPAVFRLSGLGKIDVVKDTGFSLKERYQVLEAAERCEEGVIAYEVDYSGMRDNTKFGFL